MIKKIIDNSVFLPDNITYFPQKFNILGNTFSCLDSDEKIDTPFMYAKYEALVRSWLSN